MSAIIPFDFEEQAVRVLTRDGDPWFVAADVCRVLEIVNTSQAVSRLDEDETDTVNLNTLCQTEGIRGNPNATIVSESGLYALVIRSDKPAARRFRKWLTAEVLPAIRRSGRYVLHDPAPPEAETDETLTARDWLAMIREARILGGLSAGRRIWGLSSLPPLNPARIAPAADPAEGRACLDHLMRTHDGLDGAGLSALGLRVLENGGLFVGNASTAFHGTRWASGAHRGALMAVPGVATDGSVRTLAGQSMRGIVIPAVLLEAEGYHA